MCAGYRAFLLTMEDRSVADAPGPLFPHAPRDPELHPCGRNILRGNVLGLAVAVVTAREFGTVVTAPVRDFGSALLAAQSWGACH